MATKRLRPGTWSLVKTATAAEKIQIDYDKFVMQSGQTIEFMVEKMGLYDDTNITAYRTPPSPQTVVSNIGDKEVESIKIAPKMSLK